MDDPASSFRDSYGFQDDVLDHVLLNRVERDCVDTPEYRRLFRLAQLGLVSFLYPTANHTRGTHSIGVCARAKQLIDHLNQNTPEVTVTRESRELPTLKPPHITPAERSLISLAALLHDLPHGPLSHDIEKKTHRYGEDNELKLRSYYGPYPKHDDCQRNPALYIVLFDTGRSVLARVLENYSEDFWKLLQRDAKEHTHLQAFVKLADSCGWNDLKKTLLPSLVFHLLLFEDIDTAMTSSTASVVSSFQAAEVESWESWGIGPEDHRAELHHAWYQPYRHDIVGNTLSADLLDYLARDGKRLGLANVFDPKLLKYYVLVTQPVSGVDVSSGTRYSTRCAIDLNDYKRGRIRSERINDVFRLLDFRHEIHEKAIHHRIVQTAVAMLCRAVMLAKGSPTLEDVYAIGEPRHVLAGDDQFLSVLMTDGTRKARCYHSIGQKLAERRLYRPLMMIPGDDADNLLDDVSGPEFTAGKHDAKLRMLGGILDSEYFAPLFCLICWCVERLLDHSFASTDEMDDFIGNLLRRRQLDVVRGILPSRVILWTTPYKQLYKDPALVVRAGERVDRIDRLVQQSAAGLAPTVHARLEAGMKDAESRYASMWTVYAFISDGLYYSGGLARLLNNHPCRRKDQSEHVKHLAQAQDELLRAIRVAWKWCRPQGRVERLGARISDEELAALLERFLAHAKNRDVEHLEEEAVRQRKLCGVNLQEYIHDEPGADCKDVRYRFDPRENLEAIALGGGLPVEEATTVREFLRVADLDITEIGQEELGDIVFHMGDLHALLREDGFRAAAKEGRGFHDSELRKRWLETELKTATGESDGLAAHTGVPSVTSAAEFVSRARQKRSGSGRRRSARGTAEAASLPNLDEPADSTGTRGRGVSDTETAGTER